MIYLMVICVWVFVACVGKGVSGLSLRTVIDGKFLEK